MQLIKNIYMNRKEIISKLKEKISRKEAVFCFGAGSGLSAESAARGGADLISIYTAAICRMRGLPSLFAWLPYGDVNEQMRKEGRKILPFAGNVPAIAGLGAHDPGLNLKALIGEFKETGFSGISNEPFVSTYGKELKDALDKCGFGFERELSLIAEARKQELLTLGWAADADEAVRLSGAGADIIGILVGPADISLKRAFEHAAFVNNAAKRENKEIITLIHGGPVNTPEITQRAILETGVDGVATGSPGERLPAEQAIENAAVRYSRIRL